MLFAWTMSKLPDNAYKLVSGRLYCSLTSVPDFQNHIISHWTSNQDLLDCIMASAFVPIFDTGKLTAHFRGHRFVDGSLTNSLPYPLGNNAQAQTPSCVIRYDMWRPNNRSWLWCWSDEDWARQLYAWGKEDAAQNIEELATVLSAGRNH
jgi:predicted patatin/cPLA2 family phospholipase